MPALFALIAVTAVWGITFVQVKDAVEIYPVLPFLAIRFGIASLARRSVRSGISDPRRAIPRTCRPSRSRLGSRRASSATPREYMI